MKNTIIKKMSSVLLSGAFGISVLAGAVPVTVFAEETEETQETAAEAEETEVTAAETEAEAEEQEFTVETADGQTETIVNKTGDSVSEVSYETDDDKDTLLVTEENGTVHTFEDADLTQASGYSIVKKLSFFFVYGTASDGDEQWFYETADDVTLDEPVTMYTIGMVNIREEPDGDSTLLGTADLDSEVEVLGGTSKWFRANQDDVSGYIAARYLTEDQDEAESAATTEENARAASGEGDAAASEEDSGYDGSSGYDDYSYDDSSSYDYSYDDSYSYDSYDYGYDDSYSYDSYDYSYDDSSSYDSYDSGYDDSSSYDYSYDSGSADTGSSEVGREAVYDCDGSGGGYYIVTYSDGSESYEDF